MWIYEQIVGSKVEPQRHQPEVTPPKKQIKSTTITITSGENDSVTGTEVPLASCEENRASLGFEVYHRLESIVFGHKDAVSTVSLDQDDILEDEKASHCSTRSAASADDASKASMSSSVTLNTQGMSTGSVTSEEGRCAIEVEASGSGFPLSSFEQLKDSAIVLSSVDESDLKTERSGRRCPTKRWLCFIVVSVIVAGICLMVGLAVGVSRNSFKNKNVVHATATSTVEVSEAAAVDAATPSSEEAPSNVPKEVVSDNSTSTDKDHEGSNAAWIDDSESATDDPTDIPTASSSASQTLDVTVADTDVPTESPTSSTSASQTIEVTVATADNPTTSPSAPQTVEVTVSGTTVPTELTCGEDHDLIVSSQCQSTGSESWSSTRVSYCFSRARDGDWYWIRDSNSDYDRWDYTDGASEGAMDFDSIPPGEYLVSLVRDSMQPYDVLITESLTVPDCSTTSN
jgi:hypothetical protein